jgi:hypothetical protein
MCAITENRNTGTQETGWLFARNHNAQEIKTLLLLIIGSAQKVRSSSLLLM